MQALTVLIKPASGSCNMHCDYCFYCDEAAKRAQASYGLMSEETLKSVIKRTLMRTEQNYSIAFQGGEPTLCGLSFFEKVIEYTQKYNRNHAEIHYSLQTNGYGITKDWARFFHDHGFLTGLSVDGLEHIHRKYRHGNDGGDSYEHALRAAALFDEYGVDYNILTVVHREVAENIREIYARYRERGWNYLQFITCLDPIGEVRGGKPWSLTPELYGRFLIDLFDCWYADWEKDPASVPYIRQFENYLGILLGMPPESCEQTGRCQPQTVVEADGSVYPCDFYVLDEWRLGNLNSDLLPDIREACDRLDFSGPSRIVPDECAACPHYRLCRNGCRRSRIFGEEISLEARNYFCPGYRMFFDAASGRLEHIAQTLREQAGKGR